MPNRNSNNLKPAQGIFRRFTLGFTALATLFAIGATAANSQKLAKVQAEDATWTPNAKEKATERKDLAVTASSATLTSTAESISVTFRSQKIEAYGNGASTMNVFVLPDDATWTLDAASAAYAEAKQADPDADYIEYPAHVYNVSYNKNARTEDPNIIVIPSTVSNTRGFRFLVNSIVADCCFNEKTGLVSYDNITKIFIPDTIKTIEAGAFYNVPDNVQILCEAPEYYTNDENEQVKTYPNDWTDAENVIYEYDLHKIYEEFEIDDDEVELLLNTGSPTAKKFGEGADFYLGLESETYNYPLYMEYQFEKQTGDGLYEPVEGKHMYKVPVLATNVPYDAVGSSMGYEYVTKEINIDVPEKCRVKNDSIVFHNIFPAIKGSAEEGSAMKPDVKDDEGWDGSYYAVPSIAYSVVPHFEEFFKVRPVSLSTLGNFLQFEIELDKPRGEDGYGIYPILQPAIFESNKAQIDAGTLQIRYQFSSLDQANYRFTYDDNGTLKVVSLRIRTPIKYVLVNKDNAFRMGFLVNADEVPGVTMESLRKVEFCNFVIKSDIYKPETNAIVTKSSSALHFAFVTLFDQVENAKKVNVGMVIVIFFLIYAVAFAAIAVAYFFYAKKRFRNDEFRRVNNKRFLLNSLKNFIGFALVAAAGLFIYCRWGLLRTTVVVFNPLDAFVVIFAVGGAIFLGFTIKNLVVSFKNARKRKEAARLKLDEDVADDGTH
ncbi:MAG: hypothetical protein J6A47_00480 [Bacilli bacterium]|nr:hypothetical protein [Bacilli bacterium]MBO6285704.1 hypothetical protein [Bacilli bacterium]